MMRTDNGGVFLIALLVQAAYDIESEFDLDSHAYEDVCSKACATAGDIGWPLGTKVAKQFDTQWFNGTVRKYDAAEHLYWILYDDGDSEDMEVHEVQAAVNDYHAHAGVLDGDTAAECGGVSVSIPLHVSAVSAAAVSVNEAQVALTTAACCKHLYPTFC
jgi:hypothetical protein